ncbi:TetR/AcrR family transcriptional regulator [Aquicoccus porphyridii]|uniref:TetR/AcrR family transcriptional regulator n=1 Tax=Aquicoccus porphyridii TaxID=1852029 RepID=A0A5A9ZKB3_9RHOB|nr:TetR/AcrR family transcriptional regulator [Aquicoccus porphyridii]KAA0917462.1 TetR/AcrR family transcriptional regulator [Aquicoccus porphyridii]RAI55858.1 TetR/AcrR family transcriptional regulator [Rhodobacteraceae bacterium AsT-22]
MGARAEIKRTGRKFDQVLEGARKVFMADGFERASVDDIARVAGVSKATLYSYFPDKALLFTEIARSECDRMAETARQNISIDAPIRDVLIAVATQISRLLLSDFSQRIFRICVAERDRFPELARAYYENGPEMGRKQLEQGFEEAIARGELRICDVSLAAEQFADLARSRLWLRAVLGVQTEFSDDEIKKVITGAVDTFLARYGVSPDR